MLRRASNAPLIRDYLDSRATVRSDTGAWLGWIVAALGSIGAASAALTNAFSALLPISKLGTNLVRVAFPLAVGVVCGALIVKRHQTISRIMKEEMWEYSAGARARLTAKICLPVLFGISAYLTCGLLPNRIRGIATVSGYVCKPDGNPVHSAYVDVVDADGKMISTRRERLDSFGYFIARVDPWGQAPDSLHIGDVECPAKLTAPITLRYHDTRPAQSGCNSTRDDSGPMEAVWEIVCP